MPRLLWGLCCCIALSVLAPVSAAERSQVMLVLDVSGSMWGRIEGREKILIAREVVGQILEDWNPQVDLGLIAYGHRRKGDCQDIETMVPVGPVDAAAIRGVVDGLVPKGKTPLTEAVLQAARELRYTEEKATVVLVSDGKESCDRDPCALGQELARTGVGFTAHVIGFDITAEERAPLQCLAESTGGRYFDADRAEALQTALSEAVREVEARPAQIRAVLAEGGEPLDEAALQWRAEPLAGGEALTADGSALELPPGAYEIGVRLGEAEAGATLEVAAGDQRTVVLGAGRLSVSASASGPAGSIPDPAVDWAIQNLPGEFEAAAASGPEAVFYLPADVYGVFARFQDVSQDQVLRLEAGADETVRFTFEQSAAMVNAPASAPAGSVIEVAWDGPDGKNDYIAVASPEMPANRYINYTYTRNGSPLELLLPDRDGRYEIRYVSNADDLVLGRQVIEVAPIDATLEAPDEVAAGRSIEVVWEGPDNKTDYRAVA
ncbi:MAG: VWA domain-containing protein [Candidatus Competibacterales bacterium]|nr:VWA domain-containing protein [Candidatus Competibacterales bacterium]